MKLSTFIRMYAWFESRLRKVLFWKRIYVAMFCLCRPIPS